MSMWVPNSERGPKIQSLEGENEIPHIAFLISPNFTSNFTSNNVTQRGKSQKLFKNPKGQCGGFHFHLPVTRF